MNTNTQTTYGIFIMRVALGIVLLAHSVYLKLVIFTLPGTAAYFASIGLPGPLAYVVFTAEALAGLALIAGFKTRLVAALVVPILAGATWAHAGNGWLFTNNGGGWEYPVLLTVMAAAQALLGNGAFAVDEFFAGHARVPLLERHA